MKITAILLFLSSIIFSQNSADFEGRLKLGDHEGSPESGELRWTGSDFEGYDGVAWKSLTRSQISSGEIIVDVDGNIYGILKIGSQLWMRENLRTSRYQDGSLIPELTFDRDWENDREGAWCWYWNDKQYDDAQGKLYNFHAVQNTKGLCPQGWRVPRISDWEELVTHLGSSVAGDKMKQVGTSTWTTTDDDVDNNSGFTGTPSGLRFPSGPFTSLDFFGNVAGFWSSTESSPTTSTVRYLFGSESSLDIDTESKETGISVRCIKE